MNGIYEGKKWFNCRRDTGALLRVMSLIFSSARSKPSSRYVGTEPGFNSQARRRGVRGDSDKLEFEHGGGKGKHAGNMRPRRGFHKYWLDAHSHRVAI